MSESGLPDKLEKAVREGRIGEMLEEYILRCAEETRTPGADAPEKKKAKKPAGKFPNVAGFCRYFGINRREFDRLRVRCPDEFEHILAVFEDEALNSVISPAIISVYLKKRLSYDIAVREKDTEAAGINVIFEHDVMKDGE